MADAQKTDFANKVRQLAAELAQAYSKALDLSKLYTDRGYDSGGANPITDEDISGANITAANLTLGNTLMNNFEKFMESNNPTNNTYGVTCNILRNDIGG